MNSKAHQHKHPHCQGDKNVPATLDITQFFGCCLNDDPAPIPQKIQKARAVLPNSSLIEVHHQPGRIFEVSRDMVVADLINTFPVIREYLEDLHPLGMLSPTLESTSLEMFLLDFDLDPNDICNKLNTLINPSSQSQS